MNAPTSETPTATVAKLAVSTAELCAPVEVCFPKAISHVEKLAYSTAELCAAVGISRVTAYRLEKRGLLRPVPGLRHKIYSREEVARFLSGKGVAA